MINSSSEAGETYFEQCSRQKRRKQSGRINIRRPKRKNKQPPDWDAP